MLGSMDAAIGRVVRAVDEMGIAEDTLIVFLSDNGGYATNASSNEPLRGTKMQLYEGGIREPMIWRRPGTIPAGKRFSHLVIAMDIAASALATARVTAPANLDGVNLLPLLRGETDQTLHDCLFWMTLEGRRKAVRKFRWKWIVPDEGKGDELYDLSADLREKKNLAEKEPEVLEGLKAAYNSWAEKNEQPKKGNPGQLRRYSRIPKAWTR